ncbi:MAG: glycosyl transferase [Bacteroidetes bacterium]|nr:glycosyl transferase [Bacteroidota bacterium]
MNINYCTLFDSNYLSRAIAMYQSLRKNVQEFHLYIFAFDDAALNFLEKLQLPFTTTISLKEFEDAELLEIKKTRTNTEYCWTCTPSIILYSIQHFQLKSCTYIDADLVFYSNPKELIDELGEDSILLTEHHYSLQYDLTAKSGKYCVQFMTFKNDDTGMKALTWWRNACNEWCYQRVEEGKFGDQKYLDDWTTRFEKVHVLQNIGGGVAPWNIQQYDLVREKNDFYIIEKSNQKKWKMIFYHFHGVTITEEVYTWFDIVLFRKRKLVYTQYEMPELFSRMIYEPYLSTLLQIGNKLRYYGMKINYHAVTERRRNIENRIHRFFTGKTAEANS